MQIDSDERVFLGEHSPLGAAATQDNYALHLCSRAAPRLLQLFMEYVRNRTHAMVLREKIGSIQVEEKISTTVFRYGGNYFP